MKKFVFSLQKVLELQIMQEKGVEAKLSKLVAEQNTYRLKQQDLSQKIVAQQEQLRGSMLVGANDYTQSIAVGHFIAQAEKIIENCQSEIEAREPNIELVRRELQKEQQKRKGLESLKDKRYQEYLYEYNQQLANETDETNQQIFARKKQEDEFSQLQSILE